MICDQDIFLNWCVLCEKLRLGRTIGRPHALEANQIVASNLDIVEWPPHSFGRCQPRPRQQPFLLRFLLLMRSKGWLAPTTLLGAVAALTCPRQDQVPLKLR
jgi:hypothetical protein